MRRPPPAAAAIVLSVVPSRAFAAEATPASYLRSSGTMADSILPLLWGLLVVSVAVVVIISALVLVGVLRRRERPPWPSIRIPLSETHATGWISIGVGVSTLVLIGLVVWTSITMAHIANPPTEPALTIEVRGHQWWWEVVYLDQSPSQIFKTANEIHIPVGKPVRFALKGTDVIHSFWVRVGGKTDAIPRPDEHYLVAGRQARRLSRTMFRILRTTARPHGFRRRRGSLPTRSRPGGKPRSNRHRRRRPKPSGRVNSNSLCDAARATRCAVRGPAAPWGRT